MEPKFAGTLDLETGEVKSVADNPDLVDDPNAVIETPPADGSGGEGVADEGVDNSGATADDGKGAANAQAAATTTTDYLKLWNEKAGTQFQTEDEVINEIKASRALKEQLTEKDKKLGELSVLDDPFVRDIAKANKAGIGIELYLEARKMDVDKLEAKQALYQDFLRNNSELVAIDPEFAGMKFERDYQAKYGKIGATVDVAGLDELEAKEKTLAFNQDQEFIKKSLNADSMAAKNRLNEWKKKHITIPDVPQQTAMTDEQIQAYKSQVESFVGQNEIFEIPVGDMKFNFGLKDYKETLKQELSNPFETLKKHGIDVENGLIDSTKLGKLLIAAHVGSNVGKPLSDWSLDAKNIELLKQKKIQPAPTQPIAAGAAPGAEDDLLARFGKGMAAMKAAQSQS